MGNNSSIEKTVTGSIIIRIADGASSPIPASSHYSPSYDLLAGTIRHVFGSRKHYSNQGKLDGGVVIVSPTLSGKIFFSHALSSSLQHILANFLIYLYFLKDQCLIIL